MERNLGMILCTLLLLFSLSTTKAIAQDEPAGAPSDLATLVAGTTITLSWTDNANNENAYHVERKIDDRPWRPLATLGVDSTSHTDMVEAGHSYCYRVYATTAWISGYSNEACLPVPDFPGKPNVPKGVALDRNMVLTWTCSPGALGYHVLCAQTPTSSLAADKGGEVAAPLCVFHVNKVGYSQTPGQRAACAVQAWNRNGNGPLSDLAKVPQP